MGGLYAFEVAIVGTGIIGSKRHCKGSSVDM